MCPSTRSAERAHRLLCAGIMTTLQPDSSGARGNDSALQALSIIVLVLHLATMALFAAVGLRQFAGVFQRFLCGKKAAGATPAATSSSSPAAATSAATPTAIAASDSGSPSQPDAQPATAPDVQMSALPAAAVASDANGSSDEPAQPAVPDDDSQV